MTYEQIQESVKDGKLKLHHHATKRGYLCVAYDNKVTPYDGKFGKGYIVESANLRSRTHRSTTYHDIYYYIVTE